MSETFDKANGLVSVDRLAGPRAVSARTHRKSLPKVLISLIRVITVTRQLGAKRARYCQWPSISREDESELRKRCANILQGGFRFSVTCKLCPQCGDRRLDWKSGLGRVLANTVGPFYPTIPVSACKDSRIKACQARVKIFHASIKPPRGRRSTDMSDACILRLFLLLGILGILGDSCTLAVPGP